MNKIKNDRWIHSETLRAAPGKVDADRGIIEGASIVTAGEARGHGYHLDEDFIDSVIAQGNERKAGIKVRFGHPNMCNTALGTFLGRAKNFRRVNGTAKAEIFLSNEAKATPHGDLHSYVTGMAANEADMFGMSIVFDPGPIYRKNEAGQRVDPPGSEDLDHDHQQEVWEDAGPTTYMDLDTLHAADMVDDPAANVGMFDQATVAGQVTEFLDQHPDVVLALAEADEVIEALTAYPDQVQGFIEKYKRKSTEGTMNKLFNTQKGTAAEEIEKTDPVENEDTGTTGLEADEQPTAEVEPTAEAEAEASTDEEQAEADAPAPAEEAEEAEEAADADKEEHPGEAEAEATATQATQNTADREEFARMVEDFGADIAAQVFTAGGSYQDALAMAYQNEKERNDRLTEEQATATGENTAASFMGADENITVRPLFKSSK